MKHTHTIEPSPQKTNRRFRSFFEHGIAWFMLAFAIGFNLWIYRLEPTSVVDPNDNPFQYALVERTNQIWDYATETCGINLLCFTGYLLDHWVPNWAQGYNLPHYYSHLPQIAIVASYRMLSAISSQLTVISLFSYYHIVIYLLLCFFPLSLFLAFRIIKAPPIIAGSAALIASHISTDGLYGLDPSSFLWRGYGLTSQLFAMIWIPLAIASAYRLFVNDTAIRYASVKSFTASIGSLPFVKTTIFFLILTISGHLGLGIVTILSLAVLALTKPVLGILLKQSFGVIIAKTRDQFLKLLLVYGSTIFFLSYWIVPTLLYKEYHNYSFWDPIWKFNSYGWRQIMEWFVNGDLFDFGRSIPIFTILLLIGGASAFLAKLPEQSSENQESIGRLAPFSLLFSFWLLMFFGRTTWGGLLDLIPSMKEFHQSRFIVGVHLAGLFLIPFGIWMISDTLVAIFYRVFSGIKNRLPEHIHPVLSTTLIIGVTITICALSYPQTIRYASHNDVLIRQGNANAKKQKGDLDRLITALKQSPSGRTYPGRGGSWGKNLVIAETPYYMHLSTYGIPVILWLPQTWSPNSDVEQFFIEEWKEHYNLMNINRVVTPPNHTPIQPFWQLKEKTPQWELYTVETSGYIGAGSHAAVVYSSKFDFINLVRLWLQSDYVKRGIVPQLTFNRSEMINSPIPAFEILDEATYRTRDGTIYGLFQEPPRYEAPEAKIVVKEVATKADMEFVANATIREPCERCIVFLKQTFHPNWRVWINGKGTEPFISFPFYIAVKLTTPGDHEIVFKYQPGALKMMLFTFSFMTGALLVVFLFIKYVRARIS